MSFCVGVQMLGEVAMTRSSSRLIAGASGAEIGKKSITGADQWDMARAITELVCCLPGLDIRYLYPAQARTLQ